MENKMKLDLLGIAVVAAIAIGGAQAAPMQNGTGQGRQAVGTARLSPAQRSAIVARIVATWGPFVQTVFKTTPANWAKRMASTFAAATDTNLQRAAGMKTFEGMVSELVGVNISDAKVIDSLATRAQVLKSGPIPALLGDVTDDLVYTPIAPCRIVDTRAVNYPIVGGTAHSYLGYTSTNFASQGGNSGSNCGIPPNPSALVLNVTAVNPLQAGYLTVWPYDTVQPVASSLNYGVGADVGNEIVAGMTLGSATDQFNIYAFGTTEVVVDAVGYFMAPEATPLNTAIELSTVDVPDGSDGAAVFTACPASYSMTGSYCYGAGGIPGAFLLETGPAQCTFRNNTGTGQVVTFTAVTQCAQIPGR
jgi:hypothetical protein